MNIELSRVVDALPGLVWTALPDGNVDFINRRWCQYTNLGFDESCGRGWQRVIHPADLDELLECWRSILASTEPGQMEVRLQRSDGEYRRFLFRASPLVDASGQLVKWCGMNIDIQDRRQTEAAMRAPWWTHSAGREDHFRLVADNIADLAALVAPDGQFKLANQRASAFFGATIDKLEQWAIVDAVHPDDLPVVRAAWRESLETGRPYDVQERLRRADGVYRWFHTQGMPLRNAKGHIDLWYLVQRDIDDQKRSEVLLAGEKRLLEMVSGDNSMREILEAICRLIENTASGCYCSVLLIDPSGARVAQGAAPSLPDSFMRSCIGTPVRIDAGPCVMAAHLNKQVIGADLTTDTRWSEWRPMALAHGLRSCCSTPISSAAGKVLGTFALYYSEPTTPTPLQQSLIEQFKQIAYIVIERRLSEETRNRLQAELAHVARVKSLGVLAASIAHEVYQPLSGIITNASTCQRMLAADSPDIDGARETARLTIRDANRACDVITRLRALFSKKDAAPASVDLNEATQEVISLFLRELQRGRVILRSEFADTLPPVVGDRVQLQQVIMNLVRNAADAMSDVNDRLRELTVRTERGEDDCARLIIKDTGVGISQEIADRLFEAFYTTKNDGMGIGLSVSRSIIEAHRGRLWATVNDGPGATFTFSIPLKPQDLASLDRRDVRTSDAA